MTILDKSDLCFLLHISSFHYHLAKCRQREGCGDIISPVIVGMDIPPLWDDSPGWSYPGDWAGRPAALPSSFAKPFAKVFPF